MKKVSVIFWSGTGNTESMASAVTEGAKAAGAEVKFLSVEEANIDDVSNSDAIALGCPSMGVEELEESYMEPFVESLSSLNWSGKSLALFGSYDWGDGEWMRNWQERMEGYGASMVADGFAVNLSPDDDAISNCKMLGEKLAK